MIRVWAVLVLLLVPGVAFARMEEEGKWVARGKIGVAVIDADEQEYVSGMPVNRDRSDTDFFRSTVHLEVDADYFLHDHFSLGASVAYMPQNKLQWTFIRQTERGPETRVDKGIISAVPLGLNAKFHIAPYGVVRPYVMAGYHYTFFPNTYDYFSADSSSGALFGGGFDWWIDESFGANFEIKQYLMETEIDRSQLTLDQSITKAAVNPLAVTIGAAYKF